MARTARKYPPPSRRERLIMRAVVALLGPPLFILTCWPLLRAVGAWLPR
jgi:hypothetical protein